MAKLEFEFIGIDQNFRSSASNVLKDIDKIKSAFRDVGKGVSSDALKAVLGAQKVALAEAKVEAVKLAQTHKNELATALNDSKKGFIDAKTALQEYNLEQKKLKDTQRKAKVNLFDNAGDGSLVKMRQRLNELRGVYDRLGESARNSTRVQANLVPEIQRLNQAISQAEQATGRYQRNVGNYQQKQSGANGVAMEFNRIIQDAPFGMMGIGNNIQQLAANWQHYAQQQRTAADGTKIAVSNMSLIKGALAGIFSPLNLLTLGIAAITSGWVIYDREQQKASKAIKEAKDKTQEYRESLIGLQAVQVASISNYTTEISKLETLVRVASNTANSTKERSYALKQLQDMYPKVFANLDLESVKNINASSSYLKLRDSILSAARAQSVYSRQAKLADELLTLEYKKNQQEKEQSDAMRAESLKKSIRDAQTPLERLRLNIQEDLYALPSALGSPIESIKGIFSKPVTEVTKINDELDITNNRIKEIVGEQGYLVNLAEEYQKGNTGVQDGVKGLETSTSNTTKNLKEAYDYLSKIRDLISGKQKDIDLINVDGQTKDLIELEYKWEDYFNKIADLNNKLQKDIKKGSISSTEAEKVKEGLRIAGGMGDDLMLSEQAEILKKYQDIRLEIIRKANEEAGIFEQQSRETDLAKQKIWLDEKLKELVKNGANIKQAMEDMLPADLMRTYNINIKWDDKDLEEWGKLNDKIQETIDKPFSGQNPKSIQAELEKRIGILKKLLEQLARATGQPFDQAEFDNMSKEMEDNAKKQRENKQAEKDIQDYVTIANNGLNSVFTNLKSNIDEFGLKARSVFYTLGESLGDLIKQLANKNTAKFMQQLTDGAKDFKGLADNFSNMWKNDKGQVIGAGLGMAGQYVSSLGGGVGNILGGGLSGAAAGLSAGAATGMTGGGAWGAAIGAVVGMTAGILKQAKNRRQEKILIKQMEEQKKANRLLERMSALTYASQIIGQKTEYGIVSGMKRNEYGQIVSVVQGQDIIMVADRTNNGKNR